MSAQVAAHVGISGRAERDRQFFLGMALLLLATALAGFVPTSNAILVGAAEMPPLIIHVHAAIMLIWLLLLSTQTAINAAGRNDLHRRLGQVAFVLVPLIVLVMILASSSRFITDAEIPLRRYNVMLLQIRGIVLFPVLVWWGVSARRTDSGTHKRLMIIATIAIMDAALARAGWLLPGTGARNPDYELMSAYQLMLIVPIIAYDLWTLGKVHRATLVGGGVFAVSAVLVNVFWGTEWWLQTAEALVSSLS